MRCTLGFTLIELLLVVGILATLTAVILPKFDGLQSKTNHGVGTASADDSGRLIVTYKVTKNKYPDGWDSLLNAAGDGMWTAADPTQPGIHTKLAGLPIGGGAGKLTTTTLTQGQLDSLARMGITKLFNLGLTPHQITGAAVLPGDRFYVPATLIVGSRVCILNATTTSGKKLIDSIYPANTTVGGPGSGTLPANKTVVVFGLGPKNGLIGTSMMDCPFYPNVDLTLVYPRNLVAFEVDSAGGRADFKAVFGTDGDLKSDMAADMFK